MGDEPETSLTARADVSAKLSRPERGILVLGIIFLIIVLAGLGANAIRESLIGEVCVGVGLFALLALLVCWFVLARNPPDPDLPPTTVSLTSQAGQSLALSTPRDIGAILQIIREVLHQRADLPPPHGSIPPNASPAEVERLKRYTPEECVRAAEEIQASVAAQESEAVPRIISALQRRTGIDDEPDSRPLPIEQVTLEPNIATVHGIPQAEVLGESHNGGDTQELL